MGITKKQLYKRQTILSEFGDIGQKRLQEAKIVIVGCGGLGSVAAVYLAASGVGNIHLIDFDIVDVSNLHRQVFYKIIDIGKSKSEVLANYINSITPFVNITFSDKALTKMNISDQLHKYELVVDCTDSLPVKYLINDFSVISNKVMVYGSLYKYDGYIASFNVDNGLKRTANLRDAFPTMPKDAIPNCSEVGTLNPIVGMIGLMQANEVIKIVSKTGNPLTNQILIINSNDNSQFKMQLKNAISKKKIQDIFDSENYQDLNCELQDEKLLISANKLKEILAQKKELIKTHIISVIENVDTELPFEAKIKIPLSKLEIDKLIFNKNIEYVIVCQQGISSYIAVKRIKKKYPHINIFSLKNGISRY